MQKVISKDGTQIAYDTYGNGPALIFIAGAICHRKFDPVIKDAKIFSEKFKVYLYDRRGRGDSGDHPTYSVDKEVDDLEAVIEAAGGSARVYGHSSGAVLGFEGALRFPEKIQRLYMYEAPYSPDEAERHKSYEMTEKIIDILARKKFGAAIRFFLSGIGMPKIFTYLLPLMPGWKSMKNLAPTLRYDMLLTRDPAPVERAKTLRVPTKIMYGAKSTYDFASTAKALSESIPECRLERIEGQDHMVNAKVLLPYLD